MSAQTSYTLTPANAAYPGMLDGVGPHGVETLLVETAAGIAPGLVVSKGTADDQAVLGGTAPIGVVVRRLDVENNASDAIVYDQYTPVAVVYSGRVTVSLGGAGNRGDAIKSNDTTGVITAGAAGAGETQLNGELLDTVAGAGIAKILLTPQV